MKLYHLMCRRDQCRWTGVLTRVQNLRARPL